MTGTALAALRVNNGIDRTSVEGATNLPYARAWYGGRLPQTPEDGCTGGATSTPPVQRLANPYSCCA
jgi:hypothetical protein